MGYEVSRVQKLQISRDTKHVSIQYSQRNLARADIRAGNTVTRLWVYHDRLPAWSNARAAAHIPRTSLSHTLISVDVSYTAYTHIVTMTAATLPPTIHQGILNFPGATPESKATAERLLEEDRRVHHCFWGKVGFHNHLSHQ